MQTTQYMQIKRKEKIENINVDCNGATLQLSNLRCACWQEEKMLILSDMHLGKTAHFRQHGIQIPSSVMQSDLQRLSTAIVTYNADKLLVVGDMFHKDYNADIKLFSEWKNAFKHIKFLLVKGNHDKLDDVHYSQLGIEVFKNNYTLNNLFFTHDFYTNTGFTISGHLHPGVLIRGKADQTIKLPCFVKTSQQLILPAFSKFTGLDIRSFNSTADTEYFAFTDSSIFKL